MIAKYGPVYFKGKIPKNIYPGIATDTPVAAVANVLICHEKMDPNLAYNILKTLFAAQTGTGGRPQGSQPSDPRRCRRWDPPSPSIPGPSSFLRKKGPNYNLWNFKGGGESEGRSLDDNRGLPSFPSLSRPHSRLQTLQIVLEDSETIFWETSIPDNGSFILRHCNSIYETWVEERFRTDSLTRIRLTAVKTQSPAVLEYYGLETVSTDWIPSITLLRQALPAGFLAGPGYPILRTATNPFVGSSARRNPDRNQSRRRK